MDIDEVIEQIDSRRNAALDEARAQRHNNPAMSNTLLQCAAQCDIALAIAVAGREIAKAVDNRDHPEAIVDGEPSKE